MPSTHHGVDPAYAEKIQQKYDEERNRRYRPEGPAQYVDTTRHPKFRHFAADPWYDPSLPARGRQDVPDESHTRFLIVGAGFGALLFAARLVGSGVAAEQDITIVDGANGFGGAWYWNRYPGLMCDIESSIYMPLLEETGYIPKHRYSYGAELRQHAENIAQKYNLEQNALFRSSVQNATWDDKHDEWKIQISRSTPNGNTSDVTIRADFLIMTAGILIHPKLPLIPGLDDFKGHIFHTSRWDYPYTGGFQEQPELTKLKDKKVAIIGTGATAIQVVPQLAQWAKKLYVFQRTPSSVDYRDQRLIDPEEFRATCGHKGWQRERRENFAAFTTNPSQKPSTDLVNDAWTSMPSFSGLVGSPRLKNVSRDDMADYIRDLHALDLPRQDRIRARVNEIVKDKATAEGLKPWYPGWCKRPCFHDDYLPAFNRPNVELVDTHGSGVDKITENGLSFDGKDYDVDLVVLSTGFEPWVAGSPAYRAGMKIIGRDGLSMDDKWASDLGTFQGLFTRGFPNLILPGGAQAAPAANQAHVMDVYASHVAGILARAQTKIGRQTKILIEPTAEGETEWTHKIMNTAHGLATLLNCTPSYVTNDTKLSAPTSLEQQIQSARRASWTPGLLDYIREIETWAAQGNLSGLDVRSASSATNGSARGPATTSGGVQEPASLSTSINAARNAVAALYPAQLIDSSSPGFQEAQGSFWNQRQREKTPSCFFRPENAEQVQAAIVEVVKAKCPFAIRSAGHSSNVDGSSIQGGFQFDLVNLNHIEVSKDRQTARVGPGLRWGPLLQKLERSGVAAVGGRDFGVGVGGFVFGGGISYYSNQYGWGIDNLEGADIVLANGKLVTTNKTSHPELFRALLGGGAHNFGIVTSLTLKLHPYNGFWGGMNVVVEEHIDAVFDTYDEYTRDLTADGKAHMIMDFYRHDGQMIAVQFMGYPEPRANPPIWDRMRNIPNILSTLRLADYSNLTLEMAEVTDSRGLRNMYWTLAMEYDTHLLRAIYRRWKELTEPHSARFRFALDVNHITANMRNKAAREGRPNVYGLEGPDKPLTNFLLTAVWAKESDDEEVNTILRSVGQELEKVALERGKNIPFRYMNYGHQEQDIIAGFGSQSKAFLKKVAAQYDPDGVFQKLQRGGFKIDPPQSGTRFPPLRQFEKNGLLTGRL